MRVHLHRRAPPAAAASALARPTIWFLPQQWSCCTELCGKARPLTAAAPFCPAPAAGLPSPFAQQLPILALDISLPGGSLPPAPGSAVGALGAAGALAGPSSLAAAAGGVPGAVAGAPAGGAQRLEQLLDDYLRPGQQVLAAIASGQQQQQAAAAAGVAARGVNALGGGAAAPSSSGSHEPCSSGGGEEAAGGANMDLDEVKTSLKRCRTEAFTPVHPTTGGASAAGAGAAAGAPTLPGGLHGTAGLAPPLGALPAGVSRPAPQHMGQPAAALLQEMAGQLSRLSCLAAQVRMAVIEKLEN